MILPSSPNAERVCNRRSEGWRPRATPAVVKTNEAYAKPEDVTKQKINTKRRIIMIKKPLHLNNGRMINFIACLIFTYKEGDHVCKNANHT